jgi:hypothetical protein
VPVRLQQEPQGLADLRVVLDEDDARHARLPRPGRGARPLPAGEGPYRTVRLGKELFWGGPGGGAGPASAGQSSGLILARGAGGG